MTKREYPPGATVTFLDRTATTSGPMVVASGFVNGEPVEANGVDYVPVFAERDNGREPTTIMVAEQNVLGVKLRGGS